MNVSRTCGAMLSLVVTATTLAFGAPATTQISHSKTKPAKSHVKRAAKSKPKNQLGTLRRIKGDPDEPAMNYEALVGNKGERDRTPADYAEEQYMLRAYPADEIPVAAATQSKQGFDNVRERGDGDRRGRRLTGQWSLAGPSSANFPAVLTFSGADYTTSGRITALAISPDCENNECTVWVGAAGGGIWRTKNALSGQGPSWQFLSSSFGTNAIGALTYAGGVLYAGTGEPNASGDSESGLGIYKSSNGGNSWTRLPSDVFNGRSISSIVVDPTNPNTIYVGSARGVRGVSSVTGGATSNPPGAAPFGLYKSTDGGNTFTLIWDGAGSVRGINHVQLDPSDHNTVYAAAFGVGIWRSIDAGATFTQIYVPLSAQNTQRSEFATAKLPGNKTRMYVGDGTAGSPGARFFRTDDATAAVVTFTNMAPSQTNNYCTGQCWYDNFVVSPAGHPDTVYLGGSYQYGEFGLFSNSRAVLYSTDGGATFSDVSWDATSTTAPNGLHPDQHALVVHPHNPALFFEGSDGGLMRSSGSFTDASAQCATRGLTGGALSFCQSLLWRIPTRLYGLNKGLSTLQFQSLSVNPKDARNVMGGTQDNGTFQTTGSAVVWPQIMYGDGGQSGFNAANPALRFNTFTGQAHDANFQNGDPTKWVIIGGPIAASPESALFYPPIIADPSPRAAGTIFEGSQSVWRTQDWGGDQTFLEANCPEFTTFANNPACGDFVTLGTTTLTTGALGDRAGGNVAALARTTRNTGTLWAATTTGRVFISQNADDPTAASVTFTRIDSLAPNSPGRFVSGIYVDRANPNHAWISYSGYNFNTPAQAGHVFSVTYDPNAGTATWTRVDDGAGGLADLPATAVVRDDVTGDLYVSSDFGVMRLPAGTSTWIVAGTGLPEVEVAGLTIVPGARRLYAATHGRSAWVLTLP